MRGGSPHLRGSPKASTALGIGWSDGDCPEPPISSRLARCACSGEGHRRRLGGRFVKLAIEGEYDVGVMMSTDNDLLPALEVVRDYDPSRIHVAVAAWSAPGHHQRLRLPGLWCHWLDQGDYNSVADLTRY